ncbi:MAG: hypothetical protein ABIH40_05580 [Candidatus Omnitrophota bacterium]
MESALDLNKIFKITYVFLIGYISLLPFYYFPAVYIFGLRLPLVKYLPLLLIMIIFFISLLRGSMGIKVIRGQRLSLYILTYFFLTLLSGLGTAYYRVSVLKAVYYGLTGTLLYFALYSWKKSPIDKISIFRSVVVIGFIVSSYGIATLVIKKDFLFAGLQYAKSNLIDPKILLDMGRISSSLGNPLFLGGFLSAIFPLSFFLYLFNSQQKERPNFFTAIMPVVIFIAIALTFSVGAFLSAIAFFIIYHVKIRKICNYDILPAFKRAQRLFLAGVIVLSLVLFMMTANVFSQYYTEGYLFGSVLGRFDFQRLANPQAVSSRLEGLEDAAGFLKTKFCFFGIGIGKIGSGDNRFLRVAMDNYYCLSLIERGALVAVSMLVLFYLIIKKAQNQISSPVSLEEKRLNAFLMASLAAFFINMLFWDTLNHPTLRILFWSFVGLLA